MPNAKTNIGSAHVHTMCYGSFQIAKSAANAPWSIINVHKKPCKAESQSLRKQEKAIEI